MNCRRLNKRAACFYTKVLETFGSTEMDAEGRHLVDEDAWPHGPKHARVSASRAMVRFGSVPGLRAGGGLAVTLLHVESAARLRADISSRDAQLLPSVMVGGEYVEMHVTSKAAANPRELLHCSTAPFLFVAEIKVSPAQTSARSLTLSNFIKQTASVTFRVTLTQRLD